MQTNQLPALNSPGLFFLDQIAGRAYGPFDDEFTAREYAGEIGLVDMPPVFNGPCSGAIAPSAEFLAMVATYKGAPA